MEFTAKQMVPIETINAYREHYGIKPEQIMGHCFKNEDFDKRWDDLKNLMRYYGDERRKMRLTISFDSEYPVWLASFEDL